MPALLPMRGRLLLVLLLLSAPLAGCLGGESEPRPTASDPAGSAGNATDAGVAANATYLRNLDYSREHIHDYWQGADARLLMDETLTTNTMQGVFYTAFRPLIDGRTSTSAGMVPFTLPNGTFVPEGTGELLVEVDATAALRGGEVVLSHQAANAYEYTALEAQGAQAGWTIELTAEMADVPHAKSTRWSFLLEADGAGGLLDGEVAVKVTAKRLFEIDAWPEHPDFWDAGAVTKLDLGNTTGAYDYAGQHVFYDPTESPFVIVEPAGLVPPETSALLVTLTFERDEADPKNRLNGPVLLVVKDGASSRGFAVMHGNKIVDEPGRLVYAVPVHSDSWDSPYAGSSGWAFEVHAPFGYHDDEQVIDVGGLDIGKGTFDVGIVAYRVVPPWLDEVLKDEICRSC